MFSTLATGQLATLAQFFGFSRVIQICIQIVVVICTLIALVKLFDKAGERPWKGIIPFYNFYIQCKLTWRPLFFWILMIGLAGQISLDLISYIIGLKWVFLFIYFIYDIILAAFIVVFYYRLVKAYDCPTGMVVGLFFLEPIFILIIAFGKYKYQGNVYLKERAEIKAQIESEKAKRDSDKETVNNKADEDAQK